MTFRLGKTPDFNADYLVKIRDIRPFDNVTGYPIDIWLP